jgi:hypothetical protein
MDDFLVRNAAVYEYYQQESQTSAHSDGLLALFAFRLDKVVLSDDMARVAKYFRGHLERHAVNLAIAFRLPLVPGAFHV